MSTQNLWFSCPALAGAILIAALPVFPQSEREGKDPGVGVGRLVVVGDSLSAGFQNFSLFDSSSAPLAPPGRSKARVRRVGCGAGGRQPHHTPDLLPRHSTALALDASGQIIRAAGLEHEKTPPARLMFAVVRKRKLFPLFQSSIR